MFKYRLQRVYESREPSFCLFADSVFALQQRSDEHRDRSYIYMHLSGFPIHSYLCTFSFACPSLHSTLVYLFFSQFSLPTPGRPIEVSAQSAVRLISPWISKSPAGPADSCTNLGRIETRGGNDYSARRKMIKANSSRTGKGCKQCHRYAFVWGLFTSWPG